MRIVALAALCSGLLIVSAPADEKPSPSAIEKGTVQFKPLGEQKEIPQCYRLEAHQFDYEMNKLRTLKGLGVEVYHLRFPSPVKSACPENNTVHAEYYRPRGKGPFPGVIVLDILGGNQQLSRLISTTFAENQIGALFVQMAYYGPRRPKGSNLRLLSPDVKQTLEAIKQTVLDMRRATAWLEARPEIDRQRLGILGTSLGSFMGSLTAEMEPKLKRVAIVLGGGGLVDAYYDHPQAKTARKFWEALGGTKASLARAIADVDPITCAANLKDRKVLMIAAKKDEVVPPRAAEAMWKATGKQKIIWYDAGHYTAALYIVPALQQVIEHFNAKE
jgi:dienelactone hydrolase